MNDYICECCRIIWCLVNLSKDNYKYILYPTKFRKNKINIYDDFEEIEMNDTIIVENDKSIKINQMNNYNEKIHQKEMNNNNKKKINIQYCSWPCIVKAYPNIDDINSKNPDNDKKHQFLTRAFVVCNK